MEQVKKSFSKKLMETKKGGWTPLHCTVFVDSPEIAEFLLQQGANPNGRSQDNETPLHGCASRSRVELARVLLSYGADPQAKDADGKTPIYWANQNSDDAMVALLNNPPPRKATPPASSSGSQSGGILAFIKGVFGGGRR
jgi:ankyrin repeat protein